MEERIDKFTFIRTTDGKTPMFKDLPSVEHEGGNYGLVSPITHGIRNIFSAYAVKLGDELVSGRLAPCYAVSWIADDPEDIDLDCYEDVQYLNDSFDIIRGQV